LLDRQVHQDQQVHPDLQELAVSKEEDYLQ
jgi:hypothetical protein